MKKILPLKSNTIVIWSFLVFLLLIVPVVKAVPPDVPPMQLIIKWKDPIDTLFIGMLRKDPDLCCSFSFTTVKSDSTVTEIKTVDGLPIGVIYGSIPSKFLKNLVPKLELSAVDFRKLNLIPFDYPLPSTKLQTELKSSE